MILYFTGTDKLVIMVVALSGGLVVIAIAVFFSCLYYEKIKRARSRENSM
jgi:hypothetical protein